MCVKPYSKSLDDEIDLELGAIVNVLQKGSDGWWQVRYSYFPQVFLLRQMSQMKFIIIVIKLFSVRLQ